VRKREGERGGGGGQGDVYSSRQLLRSWHNTKNINGQIETTAAEAEQKLAIDKAVTLINKLVELGLDVNEQNKRGYTPLHNSVAQGNVDVAKALLSHGADVDAGKGTGSTPFRLARKLKQKQMMKELVEWGAYVDAKEVQILYKEDNNEGYNYYGDSEVQNGFLLWLLLCNHLPGLGHWF
jgi:Ankyrin repeats (many copies)